MFPARDGLAVAGLRGLGLKERGLALAPADETFCDALDDLLRAIDYEQKAIDSPHNATGNLAWADFHRDRAERALLQGLDQQ